VVSRCLETNEALLGIKVLTVLLSCPVNVIELCVNIALPVISAFMIYASIQMDLNL
jgi:hypothetical protein